MNEKHSNPAPEDMRTNVLYSFSFSPKDQPSKTNGLGFRENHYKNYHAAMEKLFTSCKNAEIEVVHELSRNSRFHFHGWILLKDIMRFFTRDRHALVLEGTFEIDTIDNLEEWEKYVYKQKHLMEPFCNEHRIAYVIRTGVAAAEGD